MVILDKIVINALFGKRLTLPGFHEETTVITKNSRLNQNDFRYCARSKFHARFILESR